MAIASIAATIAVIVVVATTTTETKSRSRRGSREVGPRAVAGVAAALLPEMEVAELGDDLDEGVERPAFPCLPNRTQMFLGQYICAGHVCSNFTRPRQPDNGAAPQNIPPMP